MDSSIKIPEGDLILINELKNELLRQKVKMTQKDLLDKSLKFSLERKEEFMSELLGKQKSNSKEATERFLQGKKFDFGDKWLEEVDAIL